MKSIVVQFAIGVGASVLGAVVSGFILGNAFTAAVFFILMSITILIVCIYAFYHYPLDIPYKTKKRTIQLEFTDNGDCVCVNESCDVLIREGVPIIEKSYCWTGNGKEEAPVLEEGDDVQLFVPDPSQLSEKSPV